ncbi:MAG: NAD(P)H-dependent oxidoreductase [Cyclobacteriaceae bacterium]|nr:NAD(P)H-dependent oxidoreductase [Cyclobacteriaceae bacterium]
MKTLLRIDSSIRHTDSISRMMGDHFVSHWRKKHVNGRIIARDLQVSPVPHLSQSTVQAFFSGKSTSDELALSDLLIEEITISDELLITCPMYNFQIPSSLKAYFDHVVRVNKTFQHRNGDYVGMLKNKKCYLLTAMGGRKSNVNREEDFESYLRNILGFIGIDDTLLYSMDGTANKDYVITAIKEIKSKIINSIYIS